MGELPIKAQAVAYGLLFVLAVVLSPALLMALLLQGYARFQGWPASRMRNVSLLTAGSLTFGAAWASMVTADWMTVPNMVSTAVVNAFEGDLSWAGSVGLFPWIELPLAALLAWYGLHRKELNMAQNSGLRSSQRFFERTRRNQRKAAKRREKGEITPLSRGGQVVLGHRYRKEDRTVELAQDALTARHRVWLALSMERLNLHMTLVGGTGAGKTELLKRLSYGWTETAWRHLDQQSSQVLAGSPADRPGTDHASPRPLTILVQAKGGSDAVDDAFAWADGMEALGVRPDRVGVFPFQDGLNMWNMPADQLRECLHEMCKTDHRFYDTLQRGLLSLVLDAPGQGVPGSSPKFLERIDPTWLRTAWKGNSMKLAEVEKLIEAGTLMTDLMLFEDLFRTVGLDFDAGRSVTDFDALYVALNGTGQQRVASAKAKLLVELLKHELTATKRQVLFIFDEFSAVSELVEMRQLVRTSRSLGASLVLSAQSYYGLGKNPAEIDELLADMRGGHLVMAGSAMEPWSKICGTRKRAEVGAQLDGSEQTGQGTMRLQDQFIISPDELKELPARDVALIEPGSCVLASVVKPDATRRLPSQVIYTHSERELPADGRAVPRPQLVAERRQLLAQATTQAQGR